MKNILLLKGGGGSEHDISLLSAKYIGSQIDSSQFNVYEVIVTKGFKWTLDGTSCELDFSKNLILSSHSKHSQSTTIPIHAAIPCFHGSPGETGEIQSYLQLIDLPYFGCHSETSALCFNKLLTKLLLQFEGIQTTPFIQVKSQTETKGALSFFKKHKSVYVKATNQGSSIGCYRVDKQEELKECIEQAFKHSTFVIIEKEIKARELEVSVFEYGGVFHISSPGEIISPQPFYDYDTKYSSNTLATTSTVAKNISPEINQKLISICDSTISCLKLRHLSRIDFFLSEDHEIYVNEVNTFPGHTDISMFPSMMEASGVKYSDFINAHLGSLSHR